MITCSGDDILEHNQNGEWILCKMETTVETGLFLHRVFLKLKIFVLCKYFKIYTIFHWFIHTIVVSLLLFMSRNSKNKPVSAIPL